MVKCVSSCNIIVVVVVVVVVAYVLLIVVATFIHVYNWVGLCYHRPQSTDKTAREKLRSYLQKRWTVDKEGEIEAQRRLKDYFAKAETEVRRTGHL